MGTGIKTCVSVYYIMLKIRITRTTGFEILKIKLITK